MQFYLNHYQNSAYDQFGNSTLLAGIKLYTFQGLQVSGTNTKTQCSYHSLHHVCKVEFTNKISCWRLTLLAKLPFFFFFSPKYCLLQDTTTRGLTGEYLPAFQFISACLSELQPHQNQIFKEEWKRKSIVWMQNVEQLM